MTATDPRLHAVTEALLGTKPDPYAGSLSRRRAESLAPAVLPVIAAEVAAEVVAALRAMAEELQARSMEWFDLDENDERALGMHSAAGFVRQAADRLEPGQGVKEERS
jgi:hypothetical protein